MSMIGKIEHVEVITSVRDPEAGARDRHGTVHDADRKLAIQRHGRSLREDPQARLRARQPAVPTRPACFASPTGCFEHHNAVTRTRRWATGRGASSGNNSWERRGQTRSALCIDRMNAQCPQMRSGHGRSRRRRWRPASALTRAQRWTNRKNHSLSGYSGQLREGTTGLGVQQSIQQCRWRRHPSSALSPPLYDGGHYRKRASAVLKTTIDIWSYALHFRRGWALAGEGSWWHSFGTSHTP